MSSRPRHALAAATRWITVAVLQHGDALLPHVMLRLGFSRRRARKLLTALEAAQWLERSGSVRKPVFRPGRLRQVVASYPIEGLQEDLPWSRDFAPCLDLPAPVARLAQHAFTELLNNAIDHSGGRAVTVSVRQTATQLQLLVSDDGCGLFERIERSFAIDDPRLAMLELGKGKLSSQPDRHCGQGLGLVARLADIFELHANRQAFQHRAWGQAGWRSAKTMPHTGTSALVVIALDSTRSVDAALRAMNADGDGYAFDHAQVPLRLLTDHQVALASRAQARRVTERLGQFRRATLDFSGIDEVGPAFADELFRVFAARNPDVRLVPVGAGPRVQAMLHSVTAG
jgi:anti-sigma regulatory factor (Ser/Thr protein kinase)